MDVNVIVRAVGRVPFVFLKHHYFWRLKQRTKQPLGEWVYLKSASRHFLQNRCPQEVCQGSLKISLQRGHVSRSSILQINFTREAGSPLTFTHIGCLLEMNFVHDVSVKVFYRINITWQYLMQLFWRMSWRVTLHNVTVSWYWMTIFSNHSIKNINCCVNHYKAEDKTN